VALMRFMLARAVNPSLSLLEGLRMWNPMALALREAPRRKRRYQHDELDQLLS
jgi:hypothetical protein